MGEHHDQASGSHAAASGGSTPAEDALSDVLRTVRLTGALFFLVDASSPWVTELPEADAFAPLILPGAPQIISYHIVTKGPCWGGLAGGPPIRLETGDILLVPRRCVLAGEHGRDTSSGLDRSHARLLPGPGRRATGSAGQRRRRRRRPHAPRVRVPRL